MTLLVKNEEEFLIENILFHLSMGVDQFIVTDNLSHDGTMDILREFEKAGVVKIIIERNQNYDQYRWVTRMACMARDEMGADWIINNDADEFWYCPTRNLKDAITGRKENILTCQRFTLWPSDASLQDPSYRFYRNILRANHQFKKRGTERQIATIFEEHFKAMHSAEGFTEVHQGNHWVTMKNPLSGLTGDVTIYHFPFTTYAKFESKIRVGGEAYLRNKELPPVVGSHWRKYYDLLEQGKLREKYDEVVFDDQDTQYHMRRGDMSIDTTIADAVTGLQRGDN